MRWLVGLLFLLCLICLGGYVVFRGYPYKLYSGWVNGSGWNKYYELENYRRELLSPVEAPEIPPYSEDYAELWRSFPLRNAQIPLPVHHPMFLTVPFLESRGPKTVPNVGIILLNPNGREIIRIYTLPVQFEKDFTQGQDLFKLPFVRNRILKFQKDKIWKDVFSHKIEPKSKTLDEMIYDLYILYVRSKVIPENATSYSLLGEDRALLNFMSKDKDYMIEMVINYQNGNLYSYVLRTEVNNDESMKLRSKFLDAISFKAVNPAFEKFLYAEFKQMNFARQVDQEGMLYLYAAWTQNIENMDLFKEMVFYLERGRSPFVQLKPLYSFALKQYGKTFSTKKVFSDGEDPNVVLQRRIELENLEKQREAQREKEKPPLEPELTPEEKMNLYLKKAKESGPADKEDMTIH